MFGTYAKHTCVCVYVCICVYVSNKLVSHICVSNELVSHMCVSRAWLSYMNILHISGVCIQGIFGIYVQGTHMYNLSVGTSKYMGKQRKPCATRSGCRRKCICSRRPKHPPAKKPTSTHRTGRKGNHGLIYHRSRSHRPVERHPSSGPHQLSQRLQHPTKVKFRNQTKS